MVAPALLALALGTLGVIAASDPKWKKPFNVTCRVGRDVPAANFTITASNRTWPATVSHDGHQATAEVTIEHEGTVQLGCAVHVDGADVQTDATVQVYHLPVPLLNVTSTAVAGTELSGRCSVPDGAGSDARVRVRARGQELGPSRRPPVAFSLPVREEDAERGLELSCEAEMPPFAARSKSQMIRVLGESAAAAFPTGIPAPIRFSLPLSRLSLVLIPAFPAAKPRLDVESCPPQQNWTEGQEEILTCSAKGTPKPQVRCSKDGNSFVSGAVHLADRAHAGTYLCRATNELGTAERDVTVWVHYDDSVPLLPVLLGVLLPALALLGLAGAFFLYRHSTKIGEYWLWKRQPPTDGRPPAATGQLPGRCGHSQRIRDPVAGERPWRGRDPRPVPPPRPPRGRRQRGPAGATVVDAAPGLGWTGMDWDGLGW
ncbi:intercellular adhesion molecule 1-like [Anomalospiza imberbis]|uniref:intercellular adhesion molecule 1-like n=1 Tax=Anomalospiza imberbis TaxID=187417 RepID=UPI00358F977A